MIKVIVIFIFLTEKTYPAREGNFHLDSKTGEILTYYCGGQSLDSRGYEKVDNNVRTNILLECSFPNGNFQGLLEQENSDLTFNTITYRYHQDGLIKEVKVDQSQFSGNKVKNIFDINDRNTLDHFIPGQDNQDKFKRFLNQIGIKNAQHITIAPNGIELLPTAKIWIMERKNFKLKKIKSFYNSTTNVTNSISTTSSCQYNGFPEIFNRKIDDCDVTFCSANIICPQAGGNTIPAICRALSNNQCPANADDCSEENETFTMKN